MEESIVSDKAEQLYEPESKDSSPQIWFFKIMQSNGRNCIKDFFDYFADLKGNIEDIFLQDFSRGLKNSKLTLSDSIELQMFLKIIDKTTIIKTLGKQEFLDL